MDCKSIEARNYFDTEISHSFPSKKKDSRAKNIFEYIQKYFKEPIVS